MKIWKDTKDVKTKVILISIVLLLFVGISVFKILNIGVNASEVSTTATCVHSNYGYTYKYVGATGLTNYTHVKVCSNCGEEYDSEYCTERRNS